MTVKQIIKNIIAAYDPTLDLTDSSALTDLLINPASAMMDPFIAQLQFLVSNLGMNDPANISASEIDVVASNFLMTRNTGSKAAGYVELLYITPQSLTIPAGTIFTTPDGTGFTTVRQIYVPQETMQENSWNYPYYSTGPVPVVAVNTGTVGTISPGSTFTATLDPAPARITNPGAFSGGTDAESNVDFVARIVNEMISGALGSASSIKTTLMKNFATIQNISVVGMNDVEMLRDIVASGISLNNLQTKIDFYGKVSGLNDLPYPESRAYRSVFYDDPTTSGIQPDLPDVDEFTTELSTDEYSGLYKLSDAEKTVIQTINLLDESFTGPSLNPIWITSDSRTGIGVPYNSYEMGLDTIDGIQKFRMGNHITDAEVDNMTVTVTAQFLYNILNFLKLATEMPPGTASNQPPITTYTDVKNLITS